MTYETPFTVLLTVIGFLLVVFAQIKINTTYSKYRKVQNSAGLTGQDVARKILDSNGLSQISVYEISGNLSDHYNPSKKLINLSKDAEELSACRTARSRRSDRQDARLCRTSPSARDRHQR